MVISPPRACRGHDIWICDNILLIPRANRCIKTCQTLSHLWILIRGILTTSYTFLLVSCNFWESLFACPAFGPIMMKCWNDDHCFYHLNVNVWFSTFFGTMKVVSLRHIVIAFITVLFKLKAWSNYVTLRHVVLRHVTSRYVTLRHVTPRYVSRNIACQLASRVIKPINH